MRGGIDQASRTIPVFLFFSLSFFPSPPVFEPTTSVRQTLTRVCVEANGGLELLSTVSLGGIAPARRWRRCRENVEKEGTGLELLAWDDTVYGALRV